MICIAGTHALPQTQQGLRSGGDRSLRLRPVQDLQALEEAQRQGYHSRGSQAHRHFSRTECQGQGCGLAGMGSDALLVRPSPSGSPVEGPFKGGTAVHNHLPRHAHFVVVGSAGSFRQELDGGRLARLSGQGQETGQDASQLDALTDDVISAVKRTRVTHEGCARQGSAFCEDQHVTLQRRRMAQRRGTQGGSKGSTATETPPQPRNVSLVTARISATVRRGPT